jgi:N6-L-threonylcarbamoyladenine synthase
MISTKDYDFSFSGLKTAVLYAWQKLKDDGAIFRAREKSRRTKIIFAAEIQQAIIDVLIKKTIKAVKDFNAKTLILGGGVSANQELRKQFKEKIGDINFLVPKPNLSTDNGLMAAIAGFYHQEQIKPWPKIEADSNLRIE